MTHAISRLAPDNLAKTVREASIRPQSWSEEDRSFDVVWTTGAAVTRIDWGNLDYFDETLSVQPSHVRLQRLQEGGPVLVDHVANARALAGSIVPGSVRLKDGLGIARVRLADSADMADIVSKVRDGHLRTVSVGYAVHTYERSHPGEGQRATMHAIDWEPFEISLTPVPADPGAVVRSRSTYMPPHIIDRDDNPEQRPNVGGAIFRGGSPRRDREATEDQILRLCARGAVDRDFERQMLEEHASEPLSEVQFFRAYSDHLIERQNLCVPHVDVRQSGRAGHRSMRNLFSDVLYSRLSGKAVSDEAKEYEGASLVDMARSLLENEGKSMRWVRPSAVIDALARSGQHTTSDFAAILEGAGRRYMLDAFNSVASPLKRVARKRDFADFKQRNGFQAEGPAVLRHVPESAEFKRVTIQTAVNGMQLKTYGEIFSISRQLLVNDDLGIFSQLSTFWARAMAGTEASLLAGLIQGSGVVMGEDGKTLYHADHGNVLTAADIDVVSLSAARERMRTIKDRDGFTPAYITPKFLVVSPAKETKAEQVLATINSTSVDGVNPFSGKLELIVDPNLTGNSWRLFADPSTSPVLEYGNLDGQDGLYTEARLGFEVDGVDFKARTDLGGGVVDWRGTVMNPGQ